MITKSYLKIGNLPILFVVTRLVLFITLPMEGLRGFGDLVHFYRLAGMGTPYVDYWVEFPPIFPYFSSLLFKISGGREHIYDYLLVITLTLIQAASLTIFLRLAKKIHPQNQANKRSLFYFVILLVLAYGWWYFDPLAELAMILAIYWIAEGKNVRAGLAIGAGVLTKLFPIFVLPLVWKAGSLRKTITVTAISLGLVFAVYGGLYLRAPQMTIASIRSQGSKGSWETVWALLDGNFNTGNFGPESERYDPETATLPRGNSSKVAPWIVLIPFLMFGLYIFYRMRLKDTHQLIAFLSLTWGLFLLWSPGWSPQWVLYLIPLVLLTLPEKEALLLTLALVFINLLEWPVMLSRGYTLGLWLTIPVRTLLFILISWSMFQQLSGRIIGNMTNA